MTMHRSWLGGDFTARRAHPPGDGDGDGDGAGATTILTSRGKWKGLHPRIEFKDASGLPLFTLKISWWSFTNAWYLELPGGGRGGGHRQGHRIATISCYESSLCRLELDFHLTNNAASAGGLEVATLQILGDEAQVGATQVRWEGRPVALIRKTAEISMSAVTLEYEVEVAAGMDQALVRFFFCFFHEAAKIRQFWGMY